ncbi:MAG: PLP-dependent cysteine synthase family protein [Tessaracoccus sp.]|uniref:PLP-dependent cysteine synthase family protein n=1 Tax=Tessaracoccus sp. TaxID=1971211 RepID=UPI001EBEFB43|nr:PLP-dependent cysteine synthase family protein [Tessaracoccus sp.]MBK7820283.1 PLP-dependent cysteine synthase family protein [Tessaracoccus sp.]
MSVTNEAAWARWAARRIHEAHGDKETPLVECPLPERLGVRLVFKDESTHSSGSLKHRLAASLLMFGVCNGDIGPETTLVDASSGSTAVSEAFFARALGLRFVAVVPEQTSPSKLALIERMGGHIEFAAGPEAATALAARMGDQAGHVFLDQFGNASVRTNWRSGNLASALFGQLHSEGWPEPDWVVVGAGTGGTSSTLARFIRYTGRRTKVALGDPEGSAYYPCWAQDDRTVVGTASRIEGIGRPRVEPSFVPQLIDDVVTVPDSWSVAGMRALRRRGLSVGPSTGTNLVAALRIAERMQARGRRGVIASIVCDAADRYAETYDRDDWLAAQGIRLADAEPSLEAYLDGGPAPQSWTRDSPPRVRVSA